MGVTVHSRLGELLRARNLTVADLQDRIAARFGLAVDARTLDRLARSDRVRRPDLEVAAAVASVLDIGLDDIFSVDAVPLGAEDTSDSYDPADGDDVLDPEQSRRLSDLFDRRDRRALTEEEQVELNALVAAWGRAVNERAIHELAARRPRGADAGGGPRGCRACPRLVARGAGQPSVTGDTGKRRPGAATGTNHRLVPP